MKKVAIVQSSYIPWIGYFDLIGSVDEFIIYDSMQFTKRDWRNRNLIKTPQGKKWITIPVLSKGKYHQTIFDTKIDGIRWRMWYLSCTEWFRRQDDVIHKYHIKYAESSDGIHWERQDNLSGIDVSPDGWDSESVEYPYVFMHKDSKYMLYNGNNFGKTGLGLAIWN